METNLRNADTHAHVFEPGLPMAGVRRYTPAYTASAEQFIANLDAHDMGIGVLIQPSFLGTDNSYMLKTIAAYPDLLYGVAVIDPAMPYEEMEQLKKQQIAGIRLNLYGVEFPDFSTEEWQQCLANVKKLDWHVELHIDAKELPKLIPPLLDAGVKVVVDHFGKPDPAAPLADEGFQYLLSVGATGRVWVKISASYRIGGVEQGLTAAKQMMPELMASFGPRRLLWGSDWPHTQHESVVNYDSVYQVLQELVPEENTRRIILQESFEELK